MADELPVNFDDLGFTLASGGARTAPYSFRHAKTGEVILAGKDVFYTDECVPLHRRYLTLDRVAAISGKHETEWLKAYGAEACYRHAYGGKYILEQEALIPGFRQKVEQIVMEAEEVVPTCFVVDAAQDGLFEIRADTSRNYQKEGTLAQLYYILMGGKGRIPYISVKLLILYHTEGPAIDSLIGDIRIAGGRRKPPEVKHLYHASKPATLRYYSGLLSRVWDIDGSKRTELIDFLDRAILFRAKSLVMGGSEGIETAHLRSMIGDAQDCKEEVARTPKVQTVYAAAGSVSLEEYLTLLSGLQDLSGSDRTEIADFIDRLIDLRREI